MRAAALMLAVALAVGGCSDLGAPPVSRTSNSRLQQAQQTHEYPPSAMPQQHANGDAAGPVDAVRAFATAYINWTAATVTADMRSLAARSVGQARATMQLAGAGTAQDYELQRGGIANSGTVEAIASLRGRANRYVVVTLERTTATNTNAYQGLRPAWHVAIATVTRVGTGWVLSGWQPET